MGGFIKNWESFVFGLVLGGALVWWYIYSSTEYGTAHTLTSIWYFVVMAIPFYALMKMWGNWFDNVLPKLLKKESE